MMEPIRRLTDPTVGPDGKLIAKSALTPQAMKTRGAIAIPSTRVIPVIVVPGIMGSNLRITKDTRVGIPEDLDHGDPAWAPPNGNAAAGSQVTIWAYRDAAQRQRILDGDYLEVDDEGKIELPENLQGMSADQMRNRGWGEVHWDSYGGLLVDLHIKLATTYTETTSGQRELAQHWQTVIKYNRDRWNAPDMALLTEQELAKFAQFQYPVYACGYNWVKSNEDSANRLKKRIFDVIEFWTQRKFDCKQVILVTHSMGGLVARACAKQIPDKILGVVHGVMPALGAPLAYRRMACGVENWAPNKTNDIAMKGFATIAGRTPELATPAMATAGGALELLPNHLYPSPWLFATYRSRFDEREDLAHLQHENVYDMYRDFSAWFAPINVRLADPAGKYHNREGGVKGAIAKAVDQAEKFHRKLLDTYYHPNTYAYYGADPNQWSFGTFRWVTSAPDSQRPEVRALLPAGVWQAQPGSVGRSIAMPNFSALQGVLPMEFSPGSQDAPGDGTVSHQSGDGPRSRIRRIFRTAGYDHQGSYKNVHMLFLTHHLIVKIVQEAK